MKCILCSEEKSAYIESYRGANGLDYALYRCPECSIFFSDPMKPLTAGEYQGTLFEGYYSDRWEFKKALDLIGGGKKIFEVGCGDGRFLALAEKSGLHAVGVDVNEDAVKVAKERFGVKMVYNWTMNQFISAFPDEKFEAICAFHIVEHLEDPLGFARIAANIAREGALMVIAVPSQKRQSLFYSGIEEWDRPPHHLTRWDEKSISKLMDMSGFEIVAGMNEPITMKSTVEALIKSVSFGVIKKIEKGAAHNNVDRENKAVCGENRFTDMLALIKRLIFYPPAVFYYFADRLRGLTGRNMLIIARKKS